MKKYQSVPIALRVPLLATILLAVLSPLYVMAGDIIVTVAGTGAAGYSGDGANAQFAKLNQPRGLSIDPNGNILFCDSQNGRVRRCSLLTGVIDTVAGGGVAGGGNNGDGGLATSAVLLYPTAVTTDAAGNMYIAEASGNRVRRVDAASGIIITVAGTGLPFFGGDGQPATQAFLNFPSGVSIDQSGNILIADSKNQRIRQIDANTGIITTVAGGGTPAAGNGDGAAAINAFLFSADRVFCSPAGGYYIVETNDSRVRHVDNNGVISTLAGNSAFGFGGDGGPASQATLNQPGDVTVDTLNNIYICDTLNNRIRKIDGTTGDISTICGDGVGSFSGDGAAAVSAEVYQPQGIATRNGVVYIGDTLNQRVRQISSAIPPMITSPLSITGLVGAPLSYQITTNQPTLVYTALNLPAGLTLDPITGLISGTPTATGQYQTTISAGNAGGTDTKVLNITIDGPPIIILLQPTITGEIGTPFNYQISVSGSVNVYAASGLPAGLVVNNSTGVISGTPLLVGFSTVTLSVNNNYGTDIKTLIIVINPQGVGSGGQGALPIPCYTSNVTGGSAPVTVVFNPSCTYLPTPPAGSGLTYEYTAAWDYGDGSTAQSGPSSNVFTVLTPVTHTYVLENTYTVTLRVDVSIISGGGLIRNAGPSVSITDTVIVASVNYAPKATLELLSSPPTTGGNYELSVAVGESGDQDGYIFWAAIDWGDGTFTYIADSLPSRPAQPVKHLYTSAGEYTVKLSVIDNGRLPTGTVLASLPPVNNPDLSLQLIQQLQRDLIDSNVLNRVFDDPKYKPTLAQDFAIIRIPGSMKTTGGNFHVSFKKANADGIVLNLKLNTPLSSASNTRIAITIGNLALQEFVTDGRGAYVDKEQFFNFSYKAKQAMLHLSLQKSTLLAGFGLINSTAVNASVNVPLKISVNGGTQILNTTVRFVYNARAGNGGTGRKPVSVPLGR